MGKVVEKTEVVEREDLVQEDVSVSEVPEAVKEAIEENPEFAEQYMEQVEEVEAPEFSIYAINLHRPLLISRTLDADVELLVEGNNILMGGLSADKVFGVVVRIRGQTRGEGKVMLQESFVKKAIKHDIDRMEIKNGKVIAGGFEKGFSIRLQGGIVATDEKLGVEAVKNLVEKVKSEVGEENKITLSTKVLYDVLKNVEGNLIHLYMKEGNLVFIDEGRDEVQAFIVRVEELPLEEDRYLTSLNPKILRNIVKAVKKALKDKQGGAIDLYITKGKPVLIEVMDTNYTADIVVAPYLEDVENGVKVLVETLVG